MPKGIYKRPSLLEKFDRFINKNSETGCWDWTGCIVRRYGGFQVAGKLKKAHRVSYEIHKGEIPSGLFVLHHCDNPLCVNPEHLFVGTHQDNMDDREAKGRNNPQKGEDNGQSKLTDKQVVKMRKLYATGRYSQRHLSKRFGISPMQGSDILRGIAWKHLL